MKPEDLFRAGKLDDAIKALSAELRDDPSDLKKRTFLFELLCFGGEYERAEKQLDLLADQSRDAMMGGLLYKGALNAERTRQEMFQTGKLPPPTSPAGSPIRGTLNGKPFSSISDADGRLGPRLEIIAAGDYMWVGFEHIEILLMEPPKRLRDLLWAPVKLKTGPSFKEQDLGEVLVPVLAPGSSASDDTEIRLGRVTEWFRDENGTEFPLGQKLLLVDGEEVPFLEIRKLEIHAASTASP